MTATLTILADYRARQARLLAPKIAPRLTGALVEVACDYAWLPVTVAAAAVTGYWLALHAVLRPASGIPLQPWE